MHSESSDLQRILLDSPDTVTHLLETLTGELLVADVIRQSPTRASADNNLGVTAGETIIHRAAFLKGLTTDRRYVYAESLFVSERLPEQVRSRLERTNEPIGRVLIDHRAKLEREPLAQPERLAAHLGDYTSEVVWSRAYRLLVDGAPTFAISEWFLRAVLEAIQGR
jgi:chorismate-pyruvate lyase